MSLLRPLAFVLIATTLIAAGPLHADDGEYALGWVNNLVKVRKHGPFEAHEPPIRIEAARNETEPFQLVLTTNGRPIEDPDIRLTDLTSGDHRIDSRLYKLYKEHYHKLEKGSGERFFHPFPAHNGKSHAGQAWPDALVPVDAVDPMTVATGHQAFWVQLKVPKDQPAGLYRGKVHVIPENGPIKRLPVELRVWDFTLPSTPSLRIFGSVHPTGRSDKFYDMQKGATKWRRWFAEQALWFLDHGISLGSYPSEQMTLRDNNKNDHWLVTDEHRLFLDHPNTTTIWLDWFVKEPIERYRRSVRFLKANGYTDRITPIFRLGDEVKPTDFGRIRKNADQVHKVDPAVKTHLTMNQINAGLEGALDIWCPKGANIGTSVPETHIRERLAAGDEVWCYANPWYYPIDLQATHHRIIGWLDARYGLSGEYLWALNQWGDNRPFKDGVYTGRASVGAGWLAYPGGHYGVDGLLPSIRLMQIRQRMEDYEYFEIFKQRLNDVKQRLGIDDRPWLALDRAWSIAGEVARTGYDYEPDPKKLFETRRELVRRIQRIPQSPHALFWTEPRHGGTTEVAEAEVGGAVESGATIRLNGDPIELNGTRFSETIRLKKGENTIRLVVSSEDRTKRFVRTVTYEPDPQTLERMSNIADRARRAGVDVRDAFTELLSKVEETGLWLRADKDRAERVAKQLQKKRFNALLERLQASGLNEQVKQRYLGVAQKRFANDEPRSAADTLAQGLNIDGTNGPCRVYPIRYTDHYAWVMENDSIRAVFLEDGARLIEYEVDGTPLMWHGQVRPLHLSDRTWRAIGGYEDVVNTYRDVNLAMRPWQMRVAEASGTGVTLRAERDYTTARNNSPLRVRRTMTLARGEPGLTMRYAIKNLGDATATINWRAHISPAIGKNPHNDGGDPVNDHFVVPTNDPFTLPPKYAVEGRRKQDAQQTAVRLSEGYIGLFDPGPAVSLIIQCSGNIPYAYMWYKTNDHEPYQNAWKMTRNHYTVEPNNYLKRKPHSFRVEPGGTVSYAIRLNALTGVSSEAQLRQAADELPALPEG